MSAPEKYPLYANKYTIKDQLALADLNCGEEPWARAANEWIQGTEVLDAIERLGTSVWIFRDAEDSVVGFGSLEATSWKKWPPPNGPKSRLLYVRHLGIDAKYRGFPPEEDFRYSRRIMEHLISQAKKMAVEIRESKPPSKHVELLTLMVHCKNLAAQKLYRRYGFETLAGFERDNHFAMSHRLDLSSEVPSGKACG